MASKFTIKAFLIPVLILSVVLLLAIIMIALFSARKSSPPIEVLPFMLLFLFAFVWLVFGEFRTKMIQMKICGDHVTVRKFAGLGRREDIPYSLLIGFKVSNLRSRWAVYEYLYLMKDNSKMVKLSEFYHSNYEGLKSELKTKLTDLGYEKFSLRDELREMLQSCK